MPTGLTLKEYYGRLTDVQREMLCERSGVRHPALRLAVSGARPMGAKSYLRLVDAAREITPGVEPDLELMLRRRP